MPYQVLDLRDERQNDPVMQWFASMKQDQHRRQSEEQQKDKMYLESFSTLAKASKGNTAQINQILQDFVKLDPERAKRLLPVSQFNLTEDEVTSDTRNNYIQGIYQNPGANPGDGFRRDVHAFGFNPSENAQGYMASTFGKDGGEGARKIWTEEAMSAKETVDMNQQGVVRGAQAKNFEASSRSHDASAANSYASASSHKEKAETERQSRDPNSGYTQAEIRRREASGRGTTQKQTPIEEHPEYKAALGRVQKLEELIDKAKSTGKGDVKRLEQDLRGEVQRGRITVQRLQKQGMKTIAELNAGQDGGGAKPTKVYKDGKLVDVGGASARPAGRPARAQAIDGDTLNAEGRVVRNETLATPEVESGFRDMGPGGDAAKRELERLLSQGGVFTLGGQKDRYGRDLARIYREDGVDITEEMIRKGYGRRY
jgi:hypothetical protein